MSDVTEQTINIILGEDNNATLTQQWFISGKYSPVASGFAPLINGERTFATIAKAIEQAQKVLISLHGAFKPLCTLLEGVKKKRNE